MKEKRSWLQELYLLPTHLYRLIISPYIPRSCIYTPSCSTYLVDSVRKHGIIKGSALGFARIGRCHSLFMGGLDPVPEEFSCTEVKKGYTIFRKSKKHTKKNSSKEDY
jgi:putative membrane protein insertion efficiency factor